VHAHSFSTVRVAPAVDPQMQDEVPGAVVFDLARLRTGDREPDREAAISGEKGV